MIFCTKPVQRERFIDPLSPHFFVRMDSKTDLKVDLPKVDLSKRNEDQEGGSPRVPEGAPVVVSGGMYVVKRSGQKEKVHFDKITARVSKLCYGLNQTFVDPVVVSQKVCLLSLIHI